MVEKHEDDRQTPLAMLHAINLHGQIGKRFGREFNLDVATPAEALRVLIRLKKGFREFLENAEKNGITFRVMCDGKVVDFHERLLATFSKTLDIYPIIIGSKRQGTFQTIIGVVLIVAAVVITAYGDYSGTTLSAAVAAFKGGGGMFAQALAFAGAAQMLSGIATMIANPKAPGMENSGGDGKRSYLFGGANQTARQGAALPIGYGTLHVGPIVVSAGINAERLHLADNSGTDTDGDGVQDDFDGDGFPDEARV